MRQALVGLFSVSDPAHRLGEAICLYCRKGEKRANSAFCSRTCRDEAANKGPILMEIPSDHAIFASGASISFILRVQVL